MTSLESEFGRGVHEAELGGGPDEFDPPDLSPQDYAERSANIMAEAFQKTGLVEIAQIQAGVGQVHLLGRVKDEKKFIDNAVFPVLEAIDEDCDTFMGIQYFLKEGAVQKSKGRRYGWVLSFSSPNMDKVLQEVCGILDEMSGKDELMEMPLVGRAAPQSGGRGSGRRGASPLGG